MTSFSGIRQADLRPKKSLGQHFLRDTSYLDTLLDAAEISDGDRVVEIGPGKGVLTRALVDRGAHVIAVELDIRMAKFLSEEYAENPTVRIIHGDILDLAQEPQLQEPSFGSEHGYKLAANLPYYITSAILRHVLEAESKPTVAAVMVQKEVAERICSEPNNMSVLAVSVQFYAQPEMIEVVPASAFYPQPKVDSAILRLGVYKHPVIQDITPKGFFTVVRAGFGQRRKQIANSLSANLGMAKSDVRSALEDHGIDTRRRAETFSLQDWRTVCIALGRT